MADVRSTRSLEAYACMFPEQVSVTHIDRFSRKEIYLALGLPSVPTTYAQRLSHSRGYKTTFLAQSQMINLKIYSMKLVIIGRSCLISGVILTHNLYNLKIELVASDDEEDEAKDK